MNNYKHIISIGYICNITALLISLRKRDATYPFDSMATPMWAVCELVDTNFTDLFLPENIESRKIFEDSDETFLVDSKYYIRTNAKTVEGLAKYRAYLTSIIARFERVLSEATEPVLFIRNEQATQYEDRGQRIQFPEYADRDALGELHWLEQFSTIIKTKYPALQFKVLFINESVEQPFIDVPNNIVGIQCDCVDYRKRTAASQLKTVLEANATFLDENL